MVRSNCTRPQTLLFFFAVAVSTSSYMYLVKLPLFLLQQQWEQEWTRWEEEMRRSVNGSIPPLPDDDSTPRRNGRSGSEAPEPFPYLMHEVTPLLQAKDDGEGAGHEEGASSYVVPVPDYELMGTTREKLARKLRERAAQSCDRYKRYGPGSDRGPALPVLGITVATDTPGTRYLRRLLHTVDLATVGSVVVTWYDERTEAQRIGRDRAGASHGVIAQALREFVARRGFREVRWDAGGAGNATALSETAASGAAVRDTVDVDRSLVTPASRRTRLADTTSLKLLAQTAATVQQFCTFEEAEDNPERKACRNELVILRFSANLGCSAGVNNPLFTHPFAPHWLVANYDVAYPPGVLARIADALRETRRRKPDLAVHSYGYIYGRGEYVAGAAERAAVSSVAFR